MTLRSKLEECKISEPAVERSENTLQSGQIHDTTALDPEARSDY